MAAMLRLLDTDGNELTLAGRAATFGTQEAGTTSPALHLRLRNDGDLAVDFARVRAALHPSVQAGAKEDTVAATEFASAKEGTYSPQIALGTILPREEAAFWARWTVPPHAAPEDAVWALEALGAEREAP